MKRLLFISILSCATLVLGAQDLTILHLNDTHSHIEPERGGRNDGHGGVIEQAAYIDSVRCADGRGNVLLLHAGDFSQGTSYFSELDGEIEVDILNAMDFDAVCLGNHEFDNGFEALARRVSRINMPVLCANYDFSGTPLDGLVKPYAVLYKANRKIGVIGLLTDVTSVVDVSIASGLKYSHPVEVTNRYTEELKAQGCDLIICLTHLGFEGESYTDRELAASVRNVDVIVGGHSHTNLEELVKVKDLDGKDVVIVTDGKWGLNVGHLAVDFQKNRLTELYRSLKGKDAFKTGGEWFPYPSYAEREAWKSLLGGHYDFIVRAGEKYTDYEWKSVPATAYLAYERTGERGIMEKPLGDNRLALNSLVLAELAEGKGRFMDQIINGVWHLAHMPSWVLSAHLPRQASKRALPDPSEQLIDLGSSDLGVQLAVAWHFFRGEFDKADPVISKVVKDAIRKQILDPYLNPDEQRPNWWLGYDMPSVNTLNNWNPWCNSNVILCYLLLEDDPSRLDKALEQSTKSVDKFLAYIKTDGACEEGPAYWGHAAGKLYDYLQIMYDASGGKFSLFDDPQIRKMGEYISRSFVQDGWVVNFADASARLSYTPALIYNYGKAVGSDEMMDFAIYNLGNSSKSVFDAPKPVIWKDAYRCLESLRYISEMTSRSESLNGRLASGESYAGIRAELRRHVPSFTWYPETEFCYMLNPDGRFFAAKGGHNNESHNHNDIGTFLLYVDGVPMFVDAGVGTYTKKTFSSERYTIWSMCSDWHNLPVINGVTQKFGRNYRSSSVKASGGRSGRFTLDISGAYTDDASCVSWVRDFRMTAKGLLIDDTYELRERKSADVENFIVQGEVYLAGTVAPSGYKVKEGELVVVNSGKSMLMTFPKSLTPEITVMNLDDPRLTNVWGSSLRRISLISSASSPLKGRYQFVIKELK